jgi:type VI secretion system secreted protein VgrG
MAYTQENRLIAIDTPLGKDALLLAGIRGTEAISAPFSFELVMLSENHKIAFQEVVGKAVTASIVLPDGSKRFWNGIVSRFSQGRGGGEEGGDPRFSAYQATMVPWLWLLLLTTNSRIFQKLSTPDIVEKIFKEKGFSDFKMRLQGTYEPREYCVQYRETDFNFVSRLLEEEGIYYFFEHEDGKHTMIIADAPAEHKPCPRQERAYYQISAGARLEKDVITGLEAFREIRPVKVSLSDFNFTIPNTSLEANAPSKHKTGHAELEIYDYPGFHESKSEGDRQARLRMEEEEARMTRMAGLSTCRAFTSGYRFTLTGFYRSDMNDKEYVLTSVAHEASQEFHGEGSGLSYNNYFTCIPFEVRFRPRRVAEKPAVHGSQTAIVVGPKGEEIYTDEHGRVKVQFHWDREGKRDENSSCWIRVSQPWAGAGWGSLNIPRIGHEVVVDFIEGDPDRPIITGSVYHGQNRPPYPLPDEKTKSTLKSESTIGGGGFNEIRFEDKKGKEEIFVHGQKDYNTVVKNNTTHKTTKVHTIKAEEILVEGDKKVTIKAASSTIEIDAGGITIKGSPLVKINP